MTYKLAILSAALCASFTASAQQSIGFQAGVGVGRVRSDFFGNKGAPAIRMNLGVTYQRFISKHVTLGADLLYQQRGWRDRLTITDVNAQPIGTAYVPFRLNYAALPIKIGYRSVNERKGFGYARIGVVPGVLLRATAKFPTIDGYTREENTDMYATFDVAGLAEAGGGWQLNNQLRLELGGTFQYSFTSFMRPWYQSQHLGLSANLGLRYELGVKKAAAPAE